MDNLPLELRSEIFSYLRHPRLKTPHGEAMKECLRDSRGVVLNMYYEEFDRWFNTFNIMLPVQDYIEHQMYSNIESHIWEDFPRDESDSIDHMVIKNAGRWLTDFAVNCIPFYLLN